MSTYPEGSGNEDAFGVRVLQQVISIPPLLFHAGTILLHQVSHQVVPLVRIDDVAEQANHRLLREEERGEYDALINAADFISILKLKAQR